MDLCNYCTPHTAHRTLPMLKLAPMHLAPKLAPIPKLGFGYFGQGKVSRSQNRGRRPVTFLAKTFLVLL